MTQLEQYVPGPASGAQVQKHGDFWTLILVREMRHPPEKVWQALTDPAHLREWAPFEVDGNIAQQGATVKLTWVGTGRTTEAQVTRADAPRVLEFHDIRWELEPLDSGTRLTLWHICFDVLDRLLSGNPIGRLAGADAMKLSGWQRLTTEYAKQFDAGTPGPRSSTPQPPQGECQ
jgi:uncharacterized protein YndB with AHSA1/START domain